MSNKFVYWIFVIVIFVLLIGISCISITAKNFEKQSSKSGNIFYVGGSGDGNYSTIYLAIMEAFNGDTIFVYDDSSPYYEYVEVNKAINLIGENKNTTIIDGGGTGDVIRITADDAFITGFTLQNSGEYWKMAGIDIEANNAFVTNNIIRNCCDGINLYENRINNVISENIISSTSLNGIGVWYSSNNNLILNNTINSNQGDGIKLFDCKDNDIIGNFIYSNDVGIYLSGSNNNIITNNIFDSNMHSGILVTGNSNMVCNNTFFNDGIFVSVSINEYNTINDNTVNNKPLVYLEHISDMVVEQGAGQIILVFCNNITIESQEISNTSVAIQLEGSGNCNIYDNILKNNNYGIKVQFYDNNYIFNNIIQNNNYGIYAVTQDTKIERNTISNNDIGIYLFVGWNNKILYNLILKNDYGVKIEWAALNNISYNDFIKNQRHAGFQLISGDRYNNWSYNYWDRSRIFPKLIFGKVRLGNSKINIPWINFDRYPAQEQYDI
jgi:parallel beta-helix repeat protein